MRLSHARNTPGTGLALICLLLAHLTHAQSSAAAPTFPSTTPPPPAHLVEDVDAAVHSAANSSPGEFVALGTTTYFVAEDDTDGIELWKTDGTSAGTVLVCDITPGPRGSLIQRLTAVNGALLFFITDNDTSATTLWRSDGTAQGTTPVTDVPGTVTQVAVVSGAFVYTAFVSTERKDIYRSDGTAAGTTPLRSFSPVPVSLFNYMLHVSPLPDDKRALINIYTPANGIELWVTDGTPNGTILVQDIAPGPASSAPASFTTIGKQIFFTADDITHGRELWALNADDVPTAQTQVFLPIVIK